MHLMSDHVRSDERTLLGAAINPPVFFGSLIVLLIVIAATIIIGEPAEELFAKGQRIISHATGWFFILLVNLLLFFLVFLAFSKFGNIRIGGKKATPDFSRASWFAMLFSAGMGIGLVFWGVAEPISHFNYNPFVDNGDSVASAKSAMGFTFLHYGIHAWSIYTTVALALAFFTFNLKLPLTIRSIFYPILGNKIYGRLGDFIDIISVLATVVGLATSLGMGAQQVNAGMEYLFGIEYSRMAQIIIIAIITFFATGSLLAGLDKGIRRLSEVNMGLALVLLGFVILIGPTAYLMEGFVQNIGYYIDNFFKLGMWTESYSGVRDNSDWQNDWTVFYYAWWIAWSPFVGIFIARISKGRTIKEFITGVLLVPTILTFLWMSVFGGSALFYELMGDHSISEAVNANLPTAFFILLEKFPFVTISSGLSVILVASFFITSSDSGSMVVDTLTSGGRHDAPKIQKIFWAAMEGATASVLLLYGGLTALQSATTIAGLAFAFILVIMTISFYFSLVGYYEKYYSKAKHRRFREEDTGKE